MRCIAVFMLCMVVATATAQVDKGLRKARRQLDKGRPYPALRTCDALVRRGRDPQVLALRAEAHNRIAQFDKALQDAREAHATGAGDTRPAAALQAGIAHLRQDALDSADLWLERAARGPSRADAYHHLGVLAGLRGDHPLAVERFNTVLAAQPDRHTTLRERGSAWARSGDTAAARSDLDRALELAPRDPVNWNSRGFELHARYGDWARAVADYDRAIKLDPNYAFVFNNRGWAYWRMGRADRALRDIRIAERKNPRNPFVYRNLGFIAVEQGDTAKACQNFRHALALRFTERHGPEVAEAMARYCTAAPGPAGPVRSNAPAPAAPAPRTNAPQRNNAP